MHFNSIDEALNWLLSINNRHKPGCLMIDNHKVTIEELQDMNFQAASFIKNCLKGGMQDAK